jgi:hypothetical protein
MFGTMLRGPGLCVQNKQMSRVAANPAPDLRGLAMDIPILAIARGHEGHWEALCFNFDIAVQGRTFDEVQRLMFDAVESYIEDAMKEDEVTREKLLSRRVPRLVRLSWLSGLIFAALRGREYSGVGRGERDGNASSATVPFAVPCHA